jgi:hypothetical protein
MDQILSGEASSCRAQNGDFIMHSFAQIGIDR